MIEFGTTMDYNWTTSSTDSMVSGGPGGPPPDCGGLANYVTNTIIAGTLCLLGFIGNSISFAVLMLDEDSRVSAFLLQALALTDNFFLAAWCLHFSIAHAFDYFRLVSRFHVAWYYVRIYTYPLLFIGQTGTIWLTVLIALSRYLAVCHPYSAPRYCSLPVIRKCVMGIAIFSVLYNMPRFFEVKIYLRTISSNLTNVTGYKYDFAITPFGRSWFYSTIYFHALYVITSFVLPLAFLLFLNTRLTLAYRVVQRRRSMMQSRHEHHDHSITLVMIMVVLQFITCNAPARVVQMIWQYNLQPCPSAAFVLVTISNVMEVLNSSSNFIIYCVFRKQFRLNLSKRLCGSGRHGYQAADVNNGVRMRNLETNGTVLTAAYDCDSPKTQQKLMAKS